MWASYLYFFRDLVSPPLKGIPLFFHFQEIGERFVISICSQFYFFDWLFVLIFSFVFSPFIFLIFFFIDWRDWRTSSTLPYHTLAEASCIGSSFLCCQSKHRCACVFMSLNNWWAYLNFYKINVCVPLKEGSLNFKLNQWIIELLNKIRALYTAWKTKQ